MNLKDQSVPARKRDWKSIIQIFIGYLVGCWTSLEFLDWILSRYDISAFWVDILLITYSASTPSLILYLVNVRGIKGGRSGRFEKVFFSVNLVVLGVVLFVLFSSKDLGYTTKEIEIIDVEGRANLRLVMKEEFRVPVGIFDFAYDSKEDTSNSWIGRAIKVLLKYDLKQDLSLRPDAYHGIGLLGTSQKVKYASRFEKYYVDGRYEIIDDQILIKAEVHDARNGNLISNAEFQGSDLLNLLDSVTVFVRSQTTPNKKVSQVQVDLPLGEYVSSSREALRSFTSGRDIHRIDSERAKAHYVSALKADSSFTLSWLEYGTILEKKENAQNAFDVAFRGRHKLPSDLQNIIMVNYYMAFDDLDKALGNILRLLDNEPTSEEYNKIYLGILSRAGEVETFISHSKKFFNLSGDVGQGLTYINALLMNGENEEVLDLLKPFMILEPDEEDLYCLKVFPLLSAESQEKAEKALEDFRLISNQLEYLVPVLDSAMKFIGESPIDFFGKYSSDSDEILNVVSFKDEIIYYGSGQGMTFLTQIGKNRFIVGIPLLNLDIIEFERDQAGGVIAVKTSKGRFLRSIY